MKILLLEIFIVNHQTTISEMAIIAKIIAKIIADVSKNPVANNSLNLHLICKTECMSFQHQNTL